VKSKLSVVLYSEALGCFNEKDYATAEELFGEAITLNDGVSEFYLNRGKARFYNSQFQGAYSDFKRSLSLNPEDEEAATLMMQYGYKHDDEGIPGTSVRM
jgi:tetratricopeptide (TPR) repeat protein